MRASGQPASSAAISSDHFSCSMTAVLLGEVSAFGGKEAVDELIERAQSPRTVEYLKDITNWISYEEANALWEAGTLLTHNPSFARQVGEQAARRLSSSPVASLLRSLGSPEAVYRQITLTATKFSTVSRLEIADAGPGYAEITAEALDHPRSKHHCQWTIGLLSCTPLLFGMEPSIVEHDECQALGAARCRYRVIWSTREERAQDGCSTQVEALGQQLEAMKERLHSMFETASDLIAGAEIEEVLARITDRAALEVRAPRYLLAVRLSAQDDMHCHHRGFAEGEAISLAHDLVSRHPAEFPENWLVAPVSSERREYGSLMAAFDTEVRFFPQERELFAVYARYAASALDGATALLEAKRRYDESSALLRLARALASAGTSDEVAQRLADAVPMVVNCDRVGVYLWDPAAGELTRRAFGTHDPHDPLRSEDWRQSPTPNGPLQQFLEQPGQDPVFVDRESGHPILRAELERMGDVATMLVPISSQDTFLGLLGVSVRDGAHRLRPNEDLLNRLSGVAAQATTALQNGRLVDQITHQAMHDQLTGLANRLRFADELRKAVGRARRSSDAVTVFYIDLDGFKPVNDMFGHDTGDRLLAAVGERLRGCTRASDTVARLGGDEFAVLMAHATRASDADHVAARLAAAFENSFEVDGHELELTASIGRAVFPLDATTADGLLRRADTSMFEAKRRLISPR